MCVCSINRLGDMMLEDHLSCSSSSSLSCVVSSTIHHSLIQSFTVTYYSLFSAAHIVLPCIKSMQLLIFFFPDINVPTNNVMHLEHPVFRKVVTLETFVPRVSIYALDSQLL